MKFDIQSSTLATVYINHCLPYCAQVLDSAQQVGRMSISVTPEVSYKEMTNQCEALVHGKRMKMSNLMSIQRPLNNNAGELDKHQTDNSFQSV